MSPSPPENRARGSKGARGCHPVGCRKIFFGGVSTPDWGTSRGRETDDDRRPTTGRRTTYRRSTSRFQPIKSRVKRHSRPSLAQIEQALRQTVLHFSFFIFHSLLLTLHFSFFIFHSSFPLVTHSGVWYNSHRWVRGSLPTSKEVGAR